jgi:hypothetical protein
MRSLAFAAIVLMSGTAASGAVAQVASIGSDFAAISDAAFAPNPIAHMTTGDVNLSAPGGDSMDRLRFSVGETLTRTGQPLLLDRAQYQAQTYEVAVTRDWPSALSFQSGKVGLDVSPHAGVGMTSYGTSAEAGARLELSKRRDDATVQRLKDMGIGSGDKLGDQGRWYLFAAASGRAIGLNMMHGENGWDRAGWTTDPASTLVGDAQVGVGWRKGDMQTSFGYMHREVKGAHMIFGQQTRDDSMLAFTLSIKPGR